MASLLEQGARFAMQPEMFKQVELSLRTPALVDKEIIVRRNARYNRSYLVNSAEQLNNIMAFEFDSDTDEALAESLLHVEQGVAVHPVVGVMQKYASWWYVSTGTVDLVNRIKLADASPQVSAHYVYIDSGGGTVAGTLQLFEALRTAQKPVHAFVDDFSASAAVWAMSAADHISAATPISGIGSIGVMMAHNDISAYYSMIGLTRTYITSPGSERKVWGNEAEPLRAEVLTQIQSELEPIRNEFILSIQQGRGERLKVGTDHELFSGLMFHARDAKKFGLIDKIQSDEQAFNGVLSAGRRYRKKNKKSSSPVAKNQAAVSSPSINSNIMPSTSFDWLKSKKESAKTPEVTETVSEQTTDSPVVAELAPIVPEGHVAVPKEQVVAARKAHEGLEAQVTLLKQEKAAIQQELEASKKETQRLELELDSAKLKADKAAFENQKLVAKVEVLTEMLADAKPATPAASEEVTEEVPAKETETVATPAKEETPKAEETPAATAQVEEPAGEQATDPQMDKMFAMLEGMSTKLAGVTKLEEKLTALEAKVDGVEGKNAELETENTELKNANAQVRRQFNSRNRQKASVSKDVAAQGSTLADTEPNEDVQYTTNGQRRPKRTGVYADNKDAIIANVYKSRINVSGMKPTN